MCVSEELKTRETQLDEVRKQLGQWEGKLRQQQQLYEAVRSDRNHYSKGTYVRTSVLMFSRMYFYGSPGNRFYWLYACFRSVFYDLILYRNY